MIAVNSQGEPVTMLQKDRVVFLVHVVPEGTHWLEMQFAGATAQLVTAPRPPVSPALLNIPVGVCIVWWPVVNPQQQMLTVPSGMVTVVMYAVKPTSPGMLTVTLRNETAVYPVSFTLEPQQSAVTWEVTVQGRQPLWGTLWFVEGQVRIQGTYSAGGIRVPEAQFGNRVVSLEFERKSSGTMHYLPSSQVVMGIEPDGSEWGDGRIMDETRHFVAVVR